MKAMKKMPCAFICILLSGAVLISGKNFLFPGSEKTTDFPIPGKKPFEKLKASEIVSATAMLLPPDETVQITDMEELADYLRDTIIYQNDDSYNESVGQAVIFTLTMSDGTQTEVMEYNPFLVIDGVGYRTEYEPCEALNSYANRLLDDENTIIHKP